MKTINVKTHGHARMNRHTDTYKVWAGMKKRCSTPSMSSYRYYGGKGVKVCNRWLSFSNFLEDMGEKPQNMSIDRINPDGDYEPTNCRWASKTAQMNNRSNSRLITAFGKTQTIPQWCIETGLSYYTLYLRLRKGHQPEIALTKPQGHRLR